MKNYLFGKMFSRNLFNLMLVSFAFLMFAFFQSHNLIRILISFYITVISTVMFTINFYNCMLNGLIKKEKNFDYCIINILFATMNITGKSC